MGKHIAIYVRVSTRRQDTKSQEPDLRRWAAAYADGVPIKWYRDKHTGTRMDRPEWNNLEGAMRAGKVSPGIIHQTSASQVKPLRDSTCMIR